MRLSRLSLVLIVLLPHLANAQAPPAPPVRVSVAADPNAVDLPPRFLGLSYEMSPFFPKMEDTTLIRKDKALIQTFQTLGIKSLRVAANAVDDPSLAVPQEKDIDVFFSLARAAGNALNERGQWTAHRDVVEQKQNTQSNCENQIE